MKKFLLLLLMAVSIFAAGGDTLEYDAGVEGVADGDTMYTAIWYHPLKDSIQSIINGRIGNINIAADAQIALSKLDTSTSMTRFNADTIGGDPYIENSVTTRRINVDSIRGGAIIDDSIKIVGTSGLLFGVESSTPGVLRCYDNAVGVNSEGGGVNFIVKGENADPLFYCQAGNDRVYISGPADDTEIFTITTNSKSLLRLSGTETRFNDDGNAIDIIIEGDNTTDLFKTHALEDSVSINGNLGVNGINTGQGLTEVHLMNQDLQTTDDVTFDTLTVTNGLKVGSFSVTSANYDTITVANGINSTRITCDTITVANGINSTRITCDTITVANNMSINGNPFIYEQGKFYGTYFGFSTTVQDTVRYTVLGDVVTLNFDAFSATSNSVNFALDTNNVPDIIKPSVTKKSTASGGLAAGDVNVAFDCSITVGSGVPNASFVDFGILTSLPNYSIANWTNTGNKGFSQDVCITYRK